jgi:hypothetical protein
VQHGADREVALVRAEPVGIETHGAQGLQHVPLRRPPLLREHPPQQPEEPAGQLRHREVPADVDGPQVHSGLELPRQLDGRGPAGAVPVDDHRPADRPDRLRDRLRDQLADRQRRFVGTAEVQARRLQREQPDV